jgi:hypothetical protein
MVDLASIAICYTGLQNVIRPLGHASGKSTPYSGVYVGGHMAAPTAEDPEVHKPVTIKVNEKPVELPSHRVTGLQIKEAAIAQGVEIKLDFELTEEAHDKKPARTITDDEKITVTKHSEFLANDAEEDS